MGRSSVLAIATLLLVGGCGDDGDSQAQTPPEFAQLRDELVATGNELAEGDFSLQAAPLDDGVLLLKPEYVEDKVYEADDIATAVELCDAATDLPDGFTKIRVFDVFGDLAVGRPGSCEPGDYSPSAGGSSGGSDPELLTCPAALEVLAERRGGGFVEGVDAEYDPRMDWDGDGVSCE